MTDVAAAAIPAAIFSFIFGVLIYPAYERVRAWIERIRPAKWRYRDVCGRQCRIGR